MITPNNSTKYSIQKESECDFSSGKIGAWMTVYNYCIEQGMSCEHMPQKMTGIENVITFIQQLIDFKNETLAKELLP